MNQGLERQRRTPWPGRHFPIYHPLTSHPHSVTLFFPPDELSRSRQAVLSLSNQPSDAKPLLSVYYEQRGGGEQYSTPSLGIGYKTGGYFGRMYHSLPCTGLMSPTHASCQISSTQRKMPHYSERMRIPHLANVLTTCKG